MSPYELGRHEDDQSSLRSGGFTMSLWPPCCRDPTQLVLVGFFRVLSLSVVRATSDAIPLGVDVTDLGYSLTNHLDVNVLRPSLCECANMGAVDVDGCVNDRQDLM